MSLPDTHPTGDGATLVDDPVAIDRPRGPADPGLSRLVLLGSAIAGAVLRIYLMSATTSIGRPDSDEVIAGLMARRIATDGYPAFFWGQHYGGTPTLGLVWLSLRLFGTSAVAMRLPGTLLAAGCSILVWRLGRRVLSRRGAQLAGVLSWVGGPPAVYFSVREHLFYVPTVFCGLLAILFALRIREHSRPREWVGLVLALLVGVWCMPTIAYFVLPALFVLAWPSVQRRRARRRASVVDAPGGSRLGMVAGAIVAAAALAVAVGVAFVWVTRGTPKAWAETDFDYVGSWRFFFTDGLPGLLGFREMFTYRWLYGGLGVVLYLVVLAVIGVGTVFAVRRRAWDAVGLLAYPFLFALFPKATDQPNMRYLFFAVPFVAMVIARVASRRGWTSYLAIGAALLLTVHGLYRLDVVSEQDKTIRVGQVGDLGPAIDVLDREGIAAAYGDYWVSYRLAFESAERVIAAPPFKEGRYGPYFDTVHDSPRSAWVVLPGAEHDALTRSFDQLGVSYRDEPAGEFVVVIPDRAVRPEEIQGSARQAI